MEAHKLLLQYSRIDKLLHDPLEAKEYVLEELLSLLKKDLNDPLGLSDIIPHVLLGLDREQECYDFIWGWDLQRKNSSCSSCDAPISHLNVKGKDACEELTGLIESGLSLSHLVALTLLKLRLYRDFDAISDRDVDLLDGIDIDRSVGQIAQEKYEQGYDHDDFSTIAINLQRQYLKLCEHVNDMNPHFWEALATDKSASASVSVTRGPGSTDEADLVLHHCRKAWDESNDALVMIEADTAKYIRVYKLPTMKKQPNSLGRRKGTGRAFPVGLKHNANSNSDILSTAKFDAARLRMFLGNKNKLLLYADGACIDNGQKNPRGAWAVSLGCDAQTSNRVIAGRLEELGPFKHPNPATSNRAELRAVIAALRLSNWKEEGFTSITVATDSAYVVSGATTWTKKWLSNGWKLNSGHDVKNRDLWELLLGEVERWKDEAVEVRLLSIPRHLNTEADIAAKEAARTQPDRATFTDIVFGPVQPFSASRKLQHCILAVSLGGGGFSGNPWQSSLLGMAPVKPVYDPTEAVELLNGPNPPSMIFITDAVITRHREVLERIIDVMHMGAKVVAGGSFAMATTGELARCFTIIGLPWERGDYCRSTVELQSGVQDNDSTDLLPREISDKTCFIQGVEKSDGWYTDPDAKVQTAVAYTAIGAGRFGYIGFINNERGPIDVLRVMLGLPLEVQTGF